MNEKSLVVGVDGSPGSRAALEYALADAVRRQVALRVVSAVALPEFWASSYGDYVPPPAPQEMVRDVRAETQRLVDEVVAARGGVADEPRISVEARAGRPGEILVDAAEGSELLVVGHRGRGSVASVLLGSVGLHCVLHAECPVTIVRPRSLTASAEARPAEAASAPAQMDGSDPPAPGKVGDWLVVPSPPLEHQYRWGRITEVLVDGGSVRYRVRWLGDVHDSVLVPPPDARVESAARWPAPGGDAIGLWPHR